MGRKGRRNMTVWIIVIVIAVGLLVTGAVLYTKLSREHAEARNVTLDGADFSKLKDGIYTGVYEGGMYKWRANEVKVTVNSGKVTDIQQTSTKDPAADKFDKELLYKRVIDSQSLQVDTISSATLTSKAYLKAIEDALIKAQQ